ncbi:tetratricopeptide repeat protein [Planktosalinus lacus]|uniref:Beta-lactamase n=1 Tax=Planktosalinus lacus TaxID=1526573 RepID=A0A8J2V8Q2_9FLAO|nr:tetratricopeptide repeat protein [Planktosalinus lacus]GGD87770.1 hypothetical protein GCM10011312_09750 [Planktosalinus lacus]
MFKHFIFIFVLLFSNLFVVQSQSPEKEYKNKVLQLELLIKGGDTNAMVELGNLYYYGYSKNDENITNYKKAYFWFEKAAFKKHITAMYNLGYFYENGIKVNLNPKKSISWYEKSAEAGNPLAMLALIKIYKDESSSFQNIERAKMWTSTLINTTENLNISFTKEDDFETILLHFNKYGIFTPKLLLELRNISSN